MPVKSAIAEIRMEAEPAGHVCNAPGLTGLSQRLLRMLGTEASETGAPGSAQFVQRVEELCDDLANATYPADVARVELAMLDACRQYLAGARSFVTDRESAITELIEVLRQGLSDLAEESGSFTASLSGTSARVDALLDVQDIQVLKRQLAQEVDHLRRAVVEKQRRDEEAQGRLAERVKTLESTLAEEREAAAVDPLTQVANRGHFDRVLRRRVAGPPAEGSSFILALIDVDDFKAINDGHGHGIGDRVLVRVAQLLTESVRKGDLVARYGGDEFAMMMTGIGLDQAEAHLTELVVRIARSLFSYEGPRDPGSVRFTISCGIAESTRADSVESLVERADMALYAAKRRGKNSAVARRPSVWRGLLGRGPGIPLNGSRGSAPGPRGQGG